ncbi:CaiB/BaiF CoA transferase family protein [Cumulibacter manganitolerans]|uniref:CaiB/BaiF CoA transferase family protein n=1 Tax=Cumulibacter manganitolerans TaxID=1884992 RepID=UPI00129704AE|nr:CoA transferase [Cumulibacter manganitolerans]
MSTVQPRLTEHDARNADSSGSLPLAGFRIVEFGQYIAVPGAAQVLLDQGATVVKVEPPGGEACRNLAGLGPAMFNAYNRGKRMVELDLAAEADRPRALALVSDADVVLSNLKPGALERYGLSPREIHRRNPSAVILTLSGFGEEGHLSRRPGLDIAAQAESGIMWVTGSAGDEPQRVGFTVVDAASAMAAAQAVTAALLQRSRTGRGTHIRISLWDVALHLQAAGWMDWLLTGDEPVRKGNGQPSAAPAADVVRVRDGYVVISAYMPRPWQALCDAIDRPDIAADPRFATSTDRARHRPALHAALAAALAELDREEVVNRLSSVGVVVGSIRDYPDAFRARTSSPGSVFLKAPGDGPVTHLVGSPFMWDGVAPHPHPPRPLGADTALLDLDPSELWREAAAPLVTKKEES